MKNLRHISQVGITALGLTVGLAGAANAVALQGRVGINPPEPLGEEGSGVILIGTGLTGIDGNPLTDFDFVPPVGGDVGGVVELNANPFEGRNDFAAFVGEMGTIDDVTVLELLALSGLDETLTPVAPPTSIPGFIEFPDAFSFTLEGVGFPIYSFDEVLGNTTVSISAIGQFINLSDGSNDESIGTGTFSVDFAGQTPDQVRMMFDEPGEIPEGFNPGTWSSNFVVTGGDTPPPTTPEASNLLALLAMGVFGSSFLLKRKTRLGE